MTAIPAPQNSVSLKDLLPVQAKVLQTNYFLHVYIPTVGIKKEENMIEVKRITKQYGNAPVLEECSLTVKKGEIYALVGVNGAGKTTLLKLTAGFLEPTAGRIVVHDMPAWENKEKIQRYLGSLIEIPVFYEHLTAKENLNLHLEYMGVQGDVEEILETVGLEGISSKPVSAFSLGMRQRLAIARALLHKPDILILDEPFNGLDPVAADEMKRVLVQTARNGMTILISSHILGDIAQMADMVGILAGGKIQKEFDMTEYREKGTGEFEKEVLQIMKGGTV